MEPETQSTPTQNTAPSTQHTSAGTGGSTPSSTGNNRTLMAVLAYLWILIIIPFLMSKDDPFVKFHLKQGAVILALELILWVVSMQMVWILAPVIMIVNLGLLVLSIIGIVNAVQGHEKEVPLVGQFAKHINF